MSRSRPETLTESLPGLRRVLRRFAPYLRPHRAVLAGATTALVSATLMRLLEPWPLKFVIDRVVPSVAARGDTGSGSGTGVPTRRCDGDRDGIRCHRRGEEI